MLPERIQKSSLYFLILFVVAVVLFCIVGYFILGKGDPAKDNQRWEQSQRIDNGRKPDKPTAVPNQRKPVSYDDLLQLRLTELRELSADMGLPQLNLKGDVCKDEGCLDTAFELLSAMNASVDPCHDFYQFACGSWIKKNPVPEKKSRWGQLQKLNSQFKTDTVKLLNHPEHADDPKPVNQAKKYFRKCMETSAIERAGLVPLKNIINELGGWQLVDPFKWNPSKFNWVKTIAEIKRRSGKSAILDARIGPEVGNLDNQIIYLDQPAFGLPRYVSLLPFIFTDEVEAYEAFIVDVARALGSTRTEEQLKSAAWDIIALDIRLANVGAGLLSRLNMTRIYNPYNLKDYQDITDSFDFWKRFTIPWKTYLDELFKSSGVSIGRNERVVVREKEYFQKAIPILKAVDKATLANYAMWRLIQNLVEDTTSKMRTIADRYQNTLIVTPEIPPRDERCLDETGAVLGIAIGVKYKEDVKFDEKAEEEVRKMAGYMLETTEEMMNEADWMSPDSLREALKIRKELKVKMPYPTWINNKTVMEQHYEGLYLSGSYLRRKLALAEFTFRQQMKGLRLPTDWDDFDERIYPPLANAVFARNKNSVTFHVGMLQPPMFGIHRPAHHNYGSVGVVLSHEIIHAFDILKTQLDDKGNDKIWYDNATKEEYQIRAQCILDQYSGFYVEGAEDYVDGNYTLNENIADVSGLRQSFRSYKKHVRDNGVEKRLPGLESFSPEQLFFLAYANVWCESATAEGLEEKVNYHKHSPAEYRVKGSIKNSDDFGIAFNCAVDPDGMNPPADQKCRVY